MNATQTKEPSVNFVKSTNELHHIVIDGQPVEYIPNAVMMGVTLNLKWSNNVDKVIWKAN